MYDCSNICEDLMKIKPVVSRPVKIAVIGAGNRADKYLEYARRYPGRLQLVAVVELNELRRRAMADRFRLPEDRRYVNYDDFFADRVEADMVLVSTPENAHFDPAIKAIDAGYHLLLEKPIAQRLDECREIARRARERGVRVGGAMCCAIILILPKSGNWSLPASSDGSSPSITLHRSDWTGLHIAMCVGFSAGCAKRIPSCWPNAVTTSTSCCG